MLTYTVIYALIGICGLTALAIMILRIGNMIGDCPKSKGAARAAAVTITTGFAAIGAGGVIMIGALLPLMPLKPDAVLMLALGFAALCLGLGFTHAIGILRAVVMDATERRAKAA